MKSVLLTPAFVKKLSDFQRRIKAKTLSSITYVCPYEDDAKIENIL